MSRRNGSRKNRRRKRENRKTRQYEFGLLLLNEGGDVVETVLDNVGLSGGGLGST